MNFMAKPFEDYLNEKSTVKTLIENKISTKEQNSVRSSNRPNLPLNIFFLNLS